MKVFIVLMILFYSAHSQDVNGIYNRYQGAIGKSQPITLDLLITDSAVTGYYYFNEEGVQIPLTGSRKNEEIHFSSKKDTQLISSFVGKLNAGLSVIEGKWADSEKGKTYSVSFQSFLSEGSVRLHSFSKKFNYEWHKNDKGQSLGCSASYTYCYVTDMIDKSIQNKLNEVLLNSDVNGAAWLNDAVISAMESEFGSYTDEYAESFPDSIAAENSRYMNQAPQIYIWTSEEVTKVLYDENYILSAEDYEYDYTGGAHGNSGYSYMNFNLRTGEIMELEDVFKGEFTAALPGLIEGQLRKDHRIGANVSLRKAGFLIDNLELNDLFYIQHDGIGFTYNPNEIAPHSYGAIRIFLRWDQVKSLILPSGALSWVLHQ